MVQWGTQSNVNLWNLTPMRSTIVEEDTEVEATEEKEVDTTALLPKRDRSRNMGMHTECMAKECDMILCTKYEPHSKKPVCRHQRFEFMCTWVNKDGYIK